MQINKKTFLKVFLIGAGFIILHWLLNEPERVTRYFDWIKDVFSPFVLGAALAFVLNVPMRAFEGMLKKVKNNTLRRLIAIVLTFIALLLILALVFWLLIPQLIETIQSLIPKFETFAYTLQNGFQNFLNENPKAMEWVLNNPDIANFNFGALIEKMLSTLVNSLTTLMGSAISAISSLTGAMVDIVIGVVFSLYCLFQKETLARQGRKLLYAFLPERVSDRIVSIFRLSNSTFSNFLSGQCIEVVILGCLFAISMAIFRMPYIPLVSVLVAVTAFIPVVGAFVGCFIGAFLMLVNDPLQAVGFVCMFLVLQQIENNMIYPRVVGTSIGLSGMWVLLAVSVGGALMGVAGMFLMIPIASVIQTLLREYTNNRLKVRDVDTEKLEVQPPDLQSHFKQMHKRNKAKWKLKKKTVKEKQEYQD